MSNSNPPLGPLPDPVGMFRKTPTVKTVAGTAHKSVLNSSMRPEHPEDVTGEDGENAVRKYNAEVLERLMKVREHFQEAPKGFDPTEDTEFQAFCRSHLSYVNMTWVLSGRFPNDARVGPGRGADSAFPEDTPLPAGLDPALARNTAALGALADGADLVSGDDD